MFPRFFANFPPKWAHLGGDADGVPGNGGPPHHEVGVGRYPQDAPHKRDGEEFPRYTQGKLRYQESKIMLLGKGSVIFSAETRFDRISAERSMYISVYLVQKLRKIK